MSWYDSPSYLNDEPWWTTHGFWYHILRNFLCNQENDNGNNDIYKKLIIVSLGKKFVQTSIMYAYHKECIKNSNNWIIIFLFIF